MSPSTIRKALGAVKDRTSIGLAKVSSNGSVASELDVAIVKATRHGAETARVLARRGARLVLRARSLKAAEEARARARLGAEFPGAEIVALPLDLSSLSSVRSFD